MKIAIDARFWGPGHTGLGVYTENLVENLAKIDSRNTYFILLRRQVLGGVNLPGNFTKIEAEAAPYSLKEQLLLPLILYLLQPDIVHFTSINVPAIYLGRFVVTVHDLIKHFFRGRQTSTRHSFLYWLKYGAYLAVSWIAVNLSHKIIVPSNSVKELLLKEYDLPSTKIVPTYEAANLGDELLEQKFSLPAKFAIYTGNAYPHKNLDNLIKAWKEVYAKTGVKLVLVCGRSAFAKRYERLIAGHSAQKYVVFLGYLSEPQLRYAYRTGSVYVFPTLMEGFGITGLEAMAAKLPVVCSDIPVLREVYGRAAHYFDPLNPSDISDKVIAVINDRNLRRQLIKAGLMQVKKYSWEKMARETLKVYETIDGRR